MTNTHINKYTNSKCLKDPLTWWTKTITTTTQTTTTETIFCDLLHRSIKCSLPFRGPFSLHSSNITTNNIQTNITGTRKKQQQVYESKGDVESLRLRLHNGGKEEKLKICFLNSNKYIYSQRNTHLIGPDHAFCEIYVATKQSKLCEFVVLLVTLVLS